MATYVRKPLPIDSTKSKLWALASLGSAGIGIAGVQLFDLVNRETHRAHRLELTTGGIGLGTPFSASFGSSDYENFSTPNNVNFFDFNGAKMTVRETNIGLYSWTTVSFWGMSVRIADGGLNIPGIGVSQGNAKILFSDGRPVGSPDLILNLGPSPIDPQPTRYSAEEDPLVYRIPGDLLFAFDKYRLKPGRQTEDALIRIGTRLSNLPDYKYIVVGYTDSIGSDAYNKMLSKRRAETVAAWLTAHNYVRPDWIKTDGAGKKDPIASNATEDGRAQNRRVEVVGMVTRYWNDY